MAGRKEILSMLAGIVVLTPLHAAHATTLAENASCLETPSVPLDTAVSSATSSPPPGLDTLQENITQARTLNEARDRALAPTDAALNALRKARNIMPFDNELRDAENRLADAHSRIEAAETPQGVADQFSGLMVAGLDDDNAAHVNVGKVGCDYSTGELIAIVVGLILGIIPGLILLVVLC